VAGALLLSGCARVIHQDLPSPATDNKSEAGLGNLSDIDKIIAAEEEKNGIPRGLLKAITEVESGCNPYFVNTHGRSLRFKSQAEALDCIERMIRQRKLNLSIGCAQLHYKSHRNNFLSVSDMLDPKKNIAYAAKILKSLYLKYGNWSDATKRYHAAKAKYYMPYYRKVVKKYGREL
jgi:soluble lytic murein transglycosylase-like protein